MFGEVLDTLALAVLEDSLPFGLSLVISHAFCHIRSALGQSEADDIMWCSLLAMADDWDDFTIVQRFDKSLL